MTDTFSTDRLANAIRAFVIAPEVGLALLVFASFHLWPAVWEELGVRVELGDWRIFSALIAAASFLLRQAVVQAAKVSDPDSARRQVLVEWPEYWKLALRVRVAFVYAVVGALSVLGGLAMALSGAEGPLPLLLCVLGLGVQLTTTLTSAYGAWQVREILDGV